MAKWWEAPEVAQKAVIAKEKAWTDFLNHFPKAHKSRFVSEPHFDDKLNATGEVFFKESEASSSEKYFKKPSSDILLEPNQNTD